MNTCDNLLQNKDNTDIVKQILRDYMNILIKKGVITYTDEISEAEVNGLAHRYKHDIDTLSSFIETINEFKLNNLLDEGYDDELIIPDFNNHRSPIRNCLSGSVIDECDSISDKLVNIIITTILLIGYIIWTFIN